MERKIYLKQEALKFGVGSTAKEAITDNYYEVVEVDEDQVSIQLLDFNDQPLGKASILPREKLKEFIFCPDYFKDKKGSKELTIEKHVKSGDKHFEKKELFNAEFEYNRALSVDDKHLRANLGKGKTLYARGDKEEARKIFNKISNTETLYDSENKHIFNEFGIELRKKKMFEEAISNYRKAISIDPNDEILYYNLGRAYFEQGDREKAADQLKSALTIKPDFSDAQEFLSKIRPQ